VQDALWLYPYGNSGRQRVNLTDVMLDSALTMDRHVTEVTTTYAHCGRSDHCSHSTPQQCCVVATGLRQRICCTVHLQLTSTVYSSGCAELVGQSIICQAPRSASATELRQQLHWLPTHQLQTGSCHLQDQDNLCSNLHVSVDP